jgi:hypothetical protein
MEMLSNGVSRLTDVPVRGRAKRGTSLWSRLPIERAAPGAIGPEGAFSEGIVMAVIGLQGTWNVSVAVKSAAWEQRFIIAGSDNGVDGTYPGSTTTPDVLVSGEQWGINVQNNPSGPISWRASRTRFANFRVDGVFFRVDIESDDGGGGSDEDFNDLILTLSKPLAEGEWIVYGTAMSYKGLCSINPCFPPPFIAIDTAEQLKALLRHAEVRPILERIYGKDVGRLAERERFTPLLLSRSGSAPAGLVVKAGAKRAFVVKETAAERRDDAVVDIAVAKAVSAAPSAASTLLPAEASVFERLKPIRPCETAPIAQALLRFVEYDRTDAELGGAPHEGFGDREILGVSATDEAGRYLFSFQRSVAQIAEEATEDVPTGGDAAVHARPDLIIQFVDEPEGVAVHETAPFYNIANVRRINLCVKAADLVPKVCRGDRVFQYLGDIPIVNNPGAQLHADGTITNNPSLSESGPSIERGAWNGTLDIFGCFEDAAETVTHYTVEYRVADGGWTDLTVPARGLRAQADGVWRSDSYGPDDVPLSIGTRPAYRNIELEEGWSLEVEHRKVRVNLGSLLPAGPGRQVADVRFRIWGWDEHGNYVSGTYDSLRLRVDAASAYGDIAAITVPDGEDPGECGMLVLPSDDTALEVRLRALDPEGFLRDWKLTAVRGSNQAIGLTDTGTAAPPAGDYPGAVVSDARYYGTAEQTSADAEGYVTISVTPTGGWLGSHEFCGYSFELRLRDRTTDGKTTPTYRKVWDEVLGLSASGSE